MSILDNKRLTTALAVQRLLLGNDLLRVQGMLDRGETPALEDAASINRRQGRIQGLVFALRAVWGDERFRRFCETAGVDETEIGEDFLKETAAYSDDAGTIWTVSSRLSDQ